MKKLKYLIITCLSIALLSYGVIAFANGGTSTVSKDISHGDVSGNFIALVEGKSKIKVNIGNGFETYPLDKSIWVFRDQKKTALENLKSGDKLDLILNSSKKVTYIKAYSEVYLKADVTILSASPTPTPTATITAEPTPTATPEPSPSITANEDKQFLIVKEEIRVDLKKEEQKLGDEQEDVNDNHDNFGNDDNNSNDDHRDDKNKQDHDGAED